MLKDLLSNRLFIGALGLFILFVTGLLYLQYVDKQTQEEITRTEEAVKQLEASQQQNGDASRNATLGGHSDGDEPHETASEKPLADSVTSDETANRLTPDEEDELYLLYETEGFKREKLSQKQLLHLSRVWDMVL